MRLISVMMAVLLLATFMMPVASATPSFSTNVYVVTDTAQWVSSLITVDDGTLTSFTVTPNRIRLDAPGTNIVATKVVAGTCRIDIVVDGGTPDPISCTSGFRMMFTGQASTYAAGMLTPKAVAGYAEAEMPSPNTEVHYRHSIRDSHGNRHHLAENEHYAINAVWSDVGLPKTIVCSAGATLTEWTNLTVKPDNFFFGSGPRAVGTC